MKCPLFDTGRGTPGEPFPPFSRECLKEECAWWNNTNGNCAVLQLSKSIYFMGIEVAAAVKKMPHELQFRK